MPTELCPEEVTAETTASAGPGWLAGKLRDPQVLLRLSAVVFFALYVRSLTYDFVYDDLGIIVSQWYGWKSVGSLFLHDLFASATGPGSDYYRPLSAAFGLVFFHCTGAIPAWYHLAAIFINLIVFYLAYVFGRHLFRSEWMALLTATLFALHPSKVESVAWIGAAFCDGLGAIFFFSSLICYFKWRETPRKTWLGGSVLLFAACMLTKETLIVLPGLVAIHFWLSETDRERVRRTILLLTPYALVLAGYFVLRHIALTPRVVHPGVGLPYLRPSFGGANIWSAPLACWWYVKHLLLPTGLSVVYDSLIIRKPAFWNFVFPAIALLLALGAGVWLWLRNRSSQATFTIAFFVLTIAPYIVLASMVQVHDRYLYLASYGFAALIASLLLKASRVPPRIRFSAGLIVIALWTASSWHEAGFWEDNLSLWQRASVEAPASERPRLLVAGQYMQSGDIAAAMHSIELGLANHPKSAALLQSQGVLFKKQGDLTAAKAACEKAFAADDFGNIKPGSASTIGDIAMEQKNYSEAEKWYRTAVALAPADPGRHGALAKALHSQGRETEAAEQNRLEQQVSTAIRNASSPL